MDLAELKRQYRNVYFLDFQGRQIVFRLPTWREHDLYRKVMAVSTEPREQIEDRIFREIVLDPSLIDEMNTTPAGLVSTVVEVALSLAGVNLSSQRDIEKINNDLEQTRAIYKSNLFEQLIVLVCKAFPSLTPMQVEDLPYPELLRLAIMAEQILELPEPIKAEAVSKERTRSMADRAIEDAKRAREVDRVPKASEAGDEDNIRGQIESGGPMTPQQARQMEMLRRMKERQKSR